MTLALGKQSALLHRDISRRNILLGGDGAERGWRGVVIDLDKSWNVHEISTSDVAGYEVGTRMYKSISILRGGGGENQGYREFGWHDCYDDMESVFYVLVDVMLEKRLTWEGGEWAYGKKEEMPQIIQEWANDDEKEAMRSKVKFFTPQELDLDAMGLGHFWSPAARTLLTSLFKSIRRIAKLKSCYWKTGRDLAIESHYELCERDNLEEYYAEILALLDTAIEDATDQPGPSAPSTPARTPFSPANMNTPGGREIKRRFREEACVAGPSPKRGRRTSDDASEDR